jgi:hypothetical protein
MWPMRMVVQRGVVLFGVALAVIALIYGVPKGKPFREEVNAEGAVIVEGDGTSAFATQYRIAADLISEGNLTEAEKVYTELTNKEPDSPNA